MLCGVAGFEQQDAHVRVGAEPVREHAAGRAGADDYVVVALRLQFTWCTKDWVALPRSRCGMNETVVDGCRLSYRRSGSGEAVLFLHGEDGVWGWEPWMERLAERFDLIVPDHPGFGASDWPDWLDTVHDVAYFYLDVLEALDLRGVHLIGHSLGGWIACELAVRCRHALRSLTLVGSGGIRLTGVPKFDRFMVPPAEITRQELRRCEHRGAALAKSAMPAGASATCATNSPSPGCSGSRVTICTSEVAASREVPTQLIWGADDRIVPPAYAAEFARLIPDARVVTIPGCGHFPQLERPDAFLAALDGFLAGVPA